MVTGAPASRYGETVDLDEWHSSLDRLVSEAFIAYTQMLIQIPHVSNAFFALFLPIYILNEGGAL
jgi:hypothetical protein